jgi:hypothetical protein
VYVGDGADELGEDLLDLRGLEGALCEEVVVELIAGAVLEYEPDERFGDDDLVQACDVRVYELAMVVDLAREVRVVLLRRLEDYLLRVNACPRVSTSARTLEPLVSLWVAR